jgi:hypothetical protein
VLYAAQVTEAYAWTLVPSLALAGFFFRFPDLAYYWPGPIFWICVC